LEYPIIAIEDGDSLVHSRIQKNNPFVATLKTNRKTKSFFYRAAQFLIFFRGCTRLPEPHGIHNAVYEFEAFGFCNCDRLSQDLPREGAGCDVCIDSPKPRVLEA
jgi:hypothetical protein